MTHLVISSDSNKIVFHNIISFHLYKSYKNPANYLIISIPFNSNIINIYQNFNISLFYNNNLIFSGVIDKCISSKTNTDSYIKIFARSFGYILTDNYSFAQVYYLASLNDILSKHASPFGFNFDNINPSFLTKSLPSFTIMPHFSHWDIIKEFCISLSIPIPTIINKSIYILDKNISPSTTISNKQHSSDNSLLNFSSISSKILNSHNNNFYTDFISLSITIPSITSFLNIGQSVNVLDNTIPSNNKNQPFIITDISFYFHPDNIYTNLSLRSV